MRNESSADRSSARQQVWVYNSSFGHECIRHSDQRPATMARLPIISKPSPASASSSFTDNFTRRHYLSSWATRHSSQFQETRRIAATTSSKQCQQSSPNPRNRTAIKVSFRRQPQHHQLKPTVARSQDQNNDEGLAQKTKRTNPPAHGPHKHLQLFLDSPLRLQRHFVPTQQQQQIQTLHGGRKALGY